MSYEYQHVFETFFDYKSRSKEKFKISILELSFCSSKLTKHGMKKNGKFLLSAIHSSSNVICKSKIS
jgi:hypothetical protein